MAPLTSFLSTIVLVNLVCFTPTIVSASNKVSVSLYYEALCPYCSGFIDNNLGRIFQNGLISIVDLNLIPFGNALVTSDGSIICQVRSAKCSAFNCPSSDNIFRKNFPFFFLLYFAVLEVNIWHWNWRLYRFWKKNGLLEW
jgi:hypothetical protein